MIFEIRAAPPFMTNGFVLGCETSRAGLVVDPGDNVEDLLEAVRAHRLTVAHILLTHAHVDHVSGVSQARSALGATVGLHPGDRPLYDRVVQQGLMFGLTVAPQPAPDFALVPGTPIPFGEYEVHVHHTPGHSPGGLCLQVGRRGEPGTTLLVGDTLFAGSIGRTDLAGGDLATLLASIRTVLFAFGDDAVVYPGHGEPTTIGREKRENPFLQ
jgi:glyoxylase-like metal-dependent hydrolase (beta-lactamase superfamily II)